MDSSKRIINLIVTSIVTFLSIHEFVDMFPRFKFLLINILDNISKNVVICLILMLLISITGIISIIYNIGLFRKSISKYRSELIDEVAIQTPKSNYILNFIYIAFGALIVLLGLFLILITINESDAVNDFAHNLMPFIISMIIIGLGMRLLIDGLKLKRATMPR